MILKSLTMQILDSRVEIGRIVVILPRELSSRFLFCEMRLWPPSNEADRESIKLLRKKHLVKATYKQFSSNIPQNSLALGGHRQQKVHYSLCILYQFPTYRRIDEFKGGHMAMNGHECGKTMQARNMLQIDVDLEKSCSVTPLCCTKF